MHIEYWVIDGRKTNDRPVQIELRNHVYILSDGKKKYLNPHLDVFFEETNFDVVSFVINETSRLMICV